MDSKYPRFSDHTGISMLDQEIIFPNSSEYPNSENGFKIDSSSSHLNFVNVPFEPLDTGPNDLGLYLASNLERESLIPSFSHDDEPFEPSPQWTPPEGDDSSPSNDSDSSDPVLKYISQMLMEENMEDKPHMFYDYDPLALTATEKSLYDVLGEQYPSSNSPPIYVNQESPDSNQSGGSSDYGGNASTSTGSTATITTTTTSDFVDPHWIVNGGGSNGFNPVSLQTSRPYDYRFQSNSQSLVNHPNGLPDVGNGLMGSSVNEMVQNMFSESESVMQFRRGVEEASKFLPKASQLAVDLDSYKFTSELKEGAPVAVKEEEIENKSSPDESRGRKNHKREDSDLEQGRNNKQSAVYVEENELSDLFDKVLLWPPFQGKKWCCIADVKPEVLIPAPKRDEQSNGSNGGKARAKKQGKRKETVDLRSLLLLCAQAVSANDFRTANELLKQIREHSSPSGDGSQRLAHYFANGLEARLVGSDGIGVQSFFCSLTSRRMSAADMLKAYRTHLHSSPFKKLAIVFANKMILRAAEKATTLHIVDFGVLYGFQWPILIQLLSMREGGPPKLRITGIEFPQRGFRPQERIDETGRRLAKYCERFGVPFEYNPIAAKNWESIPIEDLKIKKNEVLAVNCLGRFKSLLDESVEVNCPRDAVLNLIRKINPNIFVHSIINGTYNAPFFLTRFREALFHFTSLFDIFDATLSREDPERMKFEREFFGRESMNVIACEGTERVERPETYKQWSSRTTRAGFKPLPLDQFVMEKCREKMKTWYHKDFVMDEDQNWMLLGWKGRIIYASSCWVPA